MVPDERTGGPRFAAFCERFVRHTKGRWSGQPFVLEPWQREFWWEALEVDPATVQAKVGSSFSERYWRWLSAIPRTGDRIPVLIVGDAPGPGHRRRAFVVIELGDFRDLHGEDRP